MARSSNESGRVDWSSWFWKLVAVVVLATCVRVWMGPPEMVPTAWAQIPDSGLQRQKMLDAQQQTNKLLTQLISVIREGPLNVRVISTDKKDKPKVTGPGVTGS